MAYFDIDKHVDRDLFRRLRDRGEWPSQYGLNPAPRSTTSFFASEMAHPIRAVRTYLGNRRNRREREMAIRKDALSKYY